MNVIIVGGGKVGGYVAGLLAERGNRVSIIELRTDHLERLRRELPGVNLLHGDGTDPLLLEAAGIRNAQIVAALTGSDEANLLVSSLARFEFGVAQTFARVNSPHNTWLYTSEMGVDTLIDQAASAAQQIIGNAQP